MPAVGRLWPSDDDDNDDDDGDDEVYVCDFFVYSELSAGMCLVMMMMVIKGEDSRPFSGWIFNLPAVSSVLKSKKFSLVAMQAKSLQFGLLL